MKRPLVKKPRQNTRSPKSTAELLLEIGVEELPFEFIAPALTALRESANRLFQDARLSFESVKSYGTPRRLVLVVDDLLAHQSAVVKETMGPSRMVAFDQTGQPTKADVTMLMQGFQANEAECKRLLAQTDRRLTLPAYDYCIKSSHLFNLLDARGAISVAERTGYIARVRALARQCAERYLDERAAMGHPLMGTQVTYR